MIGENNGFRPIMENTSDIDDVLPGLTEIDADGNEVERKAEKHLKKVMFVLERYLEEATFLTSKDNQDGEKVEKGIKALRHKIRRASREPEDSSTSDSTSSQSEVSSSRLEQEAV